MAEAWSEEAQQGMVVSQRSSQFKEPLIAETGGSFVSV